MSRRSDDDALIDRVRQRVMEAVEAEPPFHTVRAGEEGWQQVAPGIECKLLWVAGGQQSCMMRFAPGTRLDAHLHLADEECVVLEGTVRIGDDLVLHPGDFHVGRKDSRHPVTTTETGAVVYLRGAL